MDQMYYIGLDVHKKKIRYCVKEVSGRVHAMPKVLFQRRGRIETGLFVRWSCPAT